MVLGYLQGGSLHAVRVRRRGEGDMSLDRSVACSVPEGADPAASCREAVGGSPADLLAIARPTPELYGHTVTFELSRWNEGGGQVCDAREVLRTARWRALEQARDRAAAYFGTSLEDVVPRGSSLEKWRQTSDAAIATVFQACTPWWSRGAEGEGEFLLPLVLARRVGQGDATEGLLCVEDHQVSLVIRRGGILREVRSVPCGLRDVRQSLAAVLACAEEEAGTILEKFAAGTLADAHGRVVARLVRRDAPVWRGVLEVLCGDLAPELRPVRLEVVGNHPAVVGRWLWGPRRLHEVLGHSCRCTVLRRSEGDDTGWFTTLLLVAATIWAAPAPVPRREVQVSRRVAHV